MSNASGRNALTISLDMGKRPARKEDHISADTNPPRRMRADALKNRARILEAARIEVELGGTECSLDNVAKRAGVGPGTLYRHFPTREDLVSELLLTWVDDVQADADSTATERWDDLLDWLVRLVNHASLYRGLASTMAATESDENSPLRSAHAAVVTANGQVFDRAVQAGLVEAPVDSGEVIRLITGVAMAAEQAQLPPAQVRSMLAIVLHGLTPSHLQG
jgi:AcrR family transcriptional regulator